MFMISIIEDLTSFEQLLDHILLYLVILTMFSLTFIWNYKLAYGNNKSRVIDI